jgi:hypothetical protein
MFTSSVQPAPITKHDTLYTEERKESASIQIIGCKFITSSNNTDLPLYTYIHPTNFFFMAARLKELTM